MRDDRPELLAPAGSAEALTAAVRCGADAVYLGLSRFSARAAAQNFTPDELAQAVSYAHARGVDVHLALNTLLRADELDEAVAAAGLAGEIGVDALIVQDLGLVRRLRAAMPAMPLHASTQLSCHTPAGVDLLREMGFSRVVLAREMTREEIAACVGRGCEIEVFVHGALCMSVSGQCYLSAMLGGRSGNRGRCAQPCRLPFSAENGSGQAALSLKDQCLIDEIPVLAEMGVASLKIEGRMKRPEYVAAATAACREVLDGHPSDPALRQALRDVFSRSGYTDGYFRGQRDSRMFGVRRPEDKEATAGALSRLTPLYRRERQSVPVTLTLTLAPDKPARLTAADADGNTAEVTGEVPLSPRTQPYTPALAEETLKKSGGTPFAVVTAAVPAQSKVTLPRAALADLRRRALEELYARRAALKPVPFVGALPPAVPPVKRYGGKTVVRLSSAAQFTPELLRAADTVTLPLAEALPQGCPPERFAVELPRGMFGQTETVQRELSRWRESGVTLAVCGTVNAVPVAKEAGFALLGSIGLNVCNPDAAAEWAARGLCGAVLSFELSFAQMRPLLNGALPVGLFAYGRQPLMLCRVCPRRSAAGSCAGCGAGGGLIDRLGMRFPVQCVGGCTELLNAVRLDLAAQTAKLPETDFRYFYFTDERPEEVRQVLDRYARGIPAAEPTTRGRYRQGVE